jgi:O-antigen/teichoic acid export membrane protein
MEDLEQNTEVEQEEKVDETKEIIKKRIAIRNIIIVAISNIISLAAGVLTGFLLPKIMDKVDYSSYKTFTLYTSYIGVLHFGICDGIYLKYAGSTYDELEKSKFGVFTRFFYIVETILAAITILVGLFFLPGVYKFTAIFVGVNILAYNAITYYELISQATQRFKLVSLRNVIRASILIVVIGVLAALYFFNGFKPSYYLYTTIFLSINIVLMLWYMITYRKITFGHFDPFAKHKAELKGLYKVGFILLICNFITQVLFIVDQQFVNILFDEIDFANYAFAYSLVQLILVAINAVSVVIFPTLNKTSDENVKSNYSVLNTYLIVFMSLAIVVYYPLHWFVGFFLENYVESLPIFRIILPGILISASITAIKANIYKKLKHILLFLIMALSMLAFSILINIAAYFAFKSMFAISVATVITNAIWYIITELFLIIKYKVKWIKNLVFLILIISTYYLLYLVPNIYIGGAIYLVVYVILVAILFRKEMKDALKIFIKRKEK